MGVKGAQTMEEIRNDMNWYVGVRIHLLCLLGYKILHPLHQYANVNSQVYSNPNSLVE